MDDADRQPWDADRELTAAQAAAAIHAAVPELAGRAVQLLGSGWDFDAYEVEETWVFKFPRRAAEIERLRAELALLGALRGRTSLPVPAYAWPELSAAPFPYPFSGYRKLPGRQLLGLPADRSRVAALAGPLGAFLERLHAVPTSEVAFLAGCSKGHQDAEAWREGHRPKLRALAATAPARLLRRVERWWDDVGVIPRPFEGVPVLCHADLHPEHVLLDEGAGLEVTGVIDWGDANLGDPASDFSGFVTWGGAWAMDALLAAYGPATEGIYERACFEGTVYCLVDLDYAHRTGHPDRVAHALTLLDGLV